MSRLTDTQRTILSSASRRNDRGVDLPFRAGGSRPDREGLTTNPAGEHVIARGDVVR